MVGPIRFDGLSSGLDYTSLLEKIFEIRRRPEQIFQRRIDEAGETKNGLLEFNVGLLAFKSAADLLARPSFYGSTKAASSNESVLSASGNAANAVGAHVFSVRRLAQSHQLLSNGFQDRNTTPVTTSAATLKVELGGGFLDRRTPVADLNGGGGFDRGSIRITDGAGRVGVVDLAGAVDVQDLLDSINGATSVSVRAAVQGNRLVVTDNSGGAGLLRIEDMGGDQTASSLGIAGAAAGAVYGSDILRIAASSTLRSLNDGTGVRSRSGSDFTVTDALGASFSVDLGSASTIQQVLDAINGAASAASSGLTASLDSNANALVLQDVAGTASITVTDAAGSLAAYDLGLSSAAGALAESAATGLQGDGTGGSRLVGRSLVPSLNSTSPTILRGGYTGGADLLYGAGVVSVAGSATVNVDLSARVATTASAAAAGATSLTLGSTSGFHVGNRFRVRTSAGDEYRTVSAVGAGSVSFDRALVGSVAAGNGVTALNESLQDVLGALNGATAATGVRFRINDAGDGLRAESVAGGPASFTVSDSSGNAAAFLGLAGSSTAGAIESGDLDPRYVSESMLLASFNGGTGVAKGSFQVTDTQGKQFTVDLSGADDTTIAKAILDFNGAAAAAGSGAVARVNDKGNGLLIQDLAAGSGLLKIADLSGGRAARDLNIAGSAAVATNALIDGGLEKSVAVKANAKLDDVVSAINAAAVGITASVVNVGSGTNPFRLSLVSGRPGAGGRVTLRSDIAGLSFSTTTAAQDAVLLYGGNGGGGTEATVIQSSRNTFSGVVPGLTLNANSVSTSSVTVNVSRDNEAITSQVGRFVDAYNAIIQTANSLSTFDPKTFETGPLFGESIVRQTRLTLSRLVVGSVDGIAAADLNSLSEIGIKATANGALSYDSSVLASKLSSDFEGVQRLFILQRRITADTPLKDFNSGRGVTEHGGADFTVTAGDGASFTVDVSGAANFGALLQRINGAAGNAGRVEARLGQDGFSIELVDLTGASTAAFKVQDIGTSTVASELKIRSTLPLGETVLKGGVIGLSGDPGVGARISQRLDAITRSGDGLIAGRTQELDDQAEESQKSIQRIEDRIQKEQERFIRQFTNLEKIIAKNQSISQRLSALTSSLTQGGFSF